MGDEAAVFGKLLRAHRVRGGLTQRELAQRAGVSVRAVRDIEQGRVRHPRQDSVRRLTAAVSLDLTDAAFSVLADPSSPQRPGAERLEIRVLGPLTVHHRGRRVRVGPPHQRCLLGLLALQPNRVVGREEIMDVLWGEQPPATYRNLIHAYVARLRRLLAPEQARGSPARVIAGVDRGYQLAVDSDQLDLLRFGELAAEAREVQADDPERALELFARALACWHGPVLADLPAGLRQHPAAVALSQRRLAAVLAYADLAVGSGQHQQAADQLWGLVGEEPLHEGAHARLMLVLAGSGQRAAALELFTDLRSRLVEELGVEPGAELQEAQARVLRGDIPIAHPSNRREVEVASVQPPLAQLPADVVGFTGRAEQLEQLDGLLRAAGRDASTAVVIAVIAGMAGVGKTALAIHWAHRVASGFSDGQVYVNLHGYASGPPVRPLRALAGLLGALGVQADRIPVDLEAAAGLYRSLLAGKRMLVVLDNAASAEQVRPLLPGSPGSMVIITSRDRLTGLVATHGAHRLTLDVLTPQEAVALLARVVGEDRVAGEPEGAEELARGCGLLPLALRIAAANLTGQPGQSIAGYLAGLQAGGRLAELAVDGDPHAAVRIAFDHSFAHLSSDSQRLFRLLGLVPGPEVSVPAAAALAGSTPDQAARLLERLVDAHLVEPCEPGRYSLHDLLRLYAQERTEREDSPAERDSALGRLLDWYLHATDSAARLLYPGRLRLPVPAAAGMLPPVGFAAAAAAVAWLDDERANLVAAVQHAVAHGPQRAAWLMADALRGYFWLRRDTVEWLEVARAGLTAATGAGDRRAQAASQLSLGGAYQCVSRYPQATQHHTAALTLTRQAGWTEGQATALGNLGMVDWWSGSLQQAADHHTQALTLNRQTGRRGGQANSLLNLGLVDRDLGRLQEAADHQAQSLTLHRQLGARDGEAHALGALGEIDHDLGWLDRAHWRLTHALALHREVGDRFGEAYVLCALAAVQRDTGRLSQALDLAQAALTLAGEIGQRSTEARTRNTLASIHLRLGHQRLAVDQYRQALDLARQTTTRAAEVGAFLGLAAAEQHANHHRQAVDHAHQALTIASQAGFRVLEGQAHMVLADAHRGLGHHDQAIDHAKQARDLHRQTGHRLGQARTHRVLGCVLGDNDGLQAAVPHWWEALRLFTEMGSPEADEVRALLPT